MPANSLLVIAVLGNDEGVDLATATVSIVSGPDHGLAVVVGLAVHYLPDTNFSGVDTVTYEVCSPPGLCDTGTVTITVLPPIDPPLLRQVPSAARVWSAASGKGSSSLHAAARRREVCPAWYA